MDALPFRQLRIRAEQRRKKPDNSWRGVTVALCVGTIVAWVGFVFLSVMLHIAGAKTVAEWVFFVAGLFVFAMIGVVFAHLLWTYSVYRRWRWREIRGMNERGIKHGNAN